MKKNLSTIGFILLFIVGLSIMLYPSFSNYYNGIHSSQAITAYQEATKFAIADYETILEEARVYNESIVEGSSNFVSGKPEDPDYIDSLDVLDGMMGYLQIDKIGVSLPFYHGTDESILSVAVGHLEGSSLPTGDVGTHTVLSGHTGLPSAKLLTGLDELVVGDTFTLLVLEEVYTYQVRNIYVVLPQDIDYLEVQSDKDLCTLITCTPYGVNSHRLLIQGERIETPEDYVAPYDEETKDIVYIIQAVLFILFILLIVIFLKKKKKDKKKKAEAVKESFEQMETGNRIKQGGAFDE